MQQVLTSPYIREIAGIRTPGLWGVECALAVIGTGGPGIRTPALNANECTRGVSEDLRLCLRSGEHLRPWPSNVHSWSGRARGHAGGAHAYIVDRTSRNRSGELDRRAQHGHIGVWKHSAGGLNDLLQRSSGISTASKGQLLTFGRFSDLFATFRGTG
eukprot:428466-Prorocentrum_minimum.AAC.1